MPTTRGQPSISRASTSHGRYREPGSSLNPVGALMPANSNFGRKSSTCIKFGEHERLFGRDGDPGNPCR